LEQLAHFLVFIYLCISIFTDDSVHYWSSQLVPIITCWRPENRFLKWTLGKEGISWTLFSTGQVHSTLGILKAHN
jgi:hypothetical protein